MATYSQLQQKTSREKEKKNKETFKRMRENLRELKSELNFEGEPNENQTEKKCLFKFNVLKSINEIYKLVEHRDIVNIYKYI